MENINSQNGKEYFVMGNNKIIIKEHFRKDGKPLGIIMEKVILDVEKTAEK